MNLVSPPRSLPWTLESLALDRIEIERVRPHEDLFYLLASSSFIESGSDLYTRNLIEHFAGDDELQEWLAGYWEPEELQHGRALAAYVQRVWPEFDWERGFAAFWNEYGASCTNTELEKTRGLELAARCVVETGTASLYRALYTIAEEPVLRELMDLIRADEVRHYKHFYQAFRRYREREAIGRTRIVVAVLKRVLEIRDEDSDVALRHVFAARNPDRDPADYRSSAAQARDLLRRHIPAEMTVKMLLKPIDLPPRLLRVLERPLTRMTEILFLH